ncbi:MAG: zinc-binding dehydrogenase [Phycisphaerae bacterium]|nr:zinc-binding dehydrogenase [Saprospiraceae bacterium]
MKALIVKQLNARPEYAEMPEPLVSKGEVLVHLRAAALNHRDLFITQGQYAGIKMPVILGSDGAGECLPADLPAEAFLPAKPRQAGAKAAKRIVLYPALEWGDNPKFQGKAFRVLGMPENGTFAEQISIPRANVFPMPDHLSWEQAAALPLAGLTAWRTLFTRCQLKKGERVLITGIGGGVALTAMQLALAAGAEVFVNSGSDEKIERAVKLGAKGGANYRQAGWEKQLKQEAGGFDVIIDSAAGDGFALLPGLCNPGARIGLYGGTLGKVNGLSMQPVFWKQISILGSTMGSPREFRAMLAFVQKHEIVPVVDSVFSLSEGAKAFEQMAGGEQFGKIVVRV